MYEEKHVKYSYAVHLRDTGTVGPITSLPFPGLDWSILQYGYLLPVDHIKPTGEETTGLISYLAKFIQEDLEVSEVFSFDGY